ncbi:hypothetical protein ACKKBG_A32445 [Auxenochlorella protothecoides x Auxenochlorella symbiontica]
MLEAPPIASHPPSTSYSLAASFPTTTLPASLSTTSNIFALRAPAITPSTPSIPTDHPLATIPSAPVAATATATAVTAPSSVLAPATPPSALPSASATHTAAISLCAFAIGPCAFAIGGRRKSFSHGSIPYPCFAA